MYILVNAFYILLYSNIYSTIQQIYGKLTFQKNKIHSILIEVNIIILSSTLILR